MSIKKLKECGSMMFCFLLLTALSVCTLLTGCATGSYSTYNIDAPSAIKNNSNELFYIESIQGVFLNKEQANKMKANLLLSHPDFFTDDSSKGLKVRFFWGVNYKFDMSMFSAILSGVTYGIIPCISNMNHSGNLTATLIDRRGVVGKYTHTYDIKETNILHIFPITSYLIDGLWACILSSDVESSFEADASERLRTPHNICPENMNLFLRTCLNAMDDAQSKKVRKTIASKDKSAAAKKNRTTADKPILVPVEQQKAQLVSSDEQTAQKNVFSEEKYQDNKYAIPAPENLVPVEACSAQTLYGEWKSSQFCKAIINVKAEELISTSMIKQVYRFNDDGKLTIELTSNDKKSITISDFTYDGNTITICSKDSAGKTDFAQYKVIWYSDTEMELRILDVKAMKKRLMIGNIKDAEYIVKDNGISYTQMILQSDDPNVTPQVTIISAPLIFEKSAKKE